MTDERDEPGEPSRPAGEGYGVPLTGDELEPLSTGNESLNRQLGGGIPPGDLVAVVVPPASQSERLLYTVAAANPTRYLSTLRPSVEVEEAMAAVGVGPLAAEPDDPDDGHRGGIDVREVGGDDLLDDPAAHLSGLEPRSVVALDPATQPERASEERYRAFLDDLKRHLRATESVGLLHCPRAAPRPLRRDLTLARADLTLDLRREVDEHGVEHHLTVGKFRRGRAPTERIRLSFDHLAEVVRTRDIA